MLPEEKEKLVGDAEVFEGIARSEDADGATKGLAGNGGSDGTAAESRR